MNYSQQALFQTEELSLEDSLVKTYPWLENVLDLLAKEAHYSTKSPESPTKQKRSGSSSKTSPVYLTVNEERTWEQLSERWLTSGTAYPGGCLMLKTLESPSGGAVSSSLRDVLEIQPVPQKYFLSAKACQGILHRAAKRGKILPERLAKALEIQSSTPAPDSESSPKG